MDTPAADDLAAIRARSRAAVARAITTLENDLPGAAALSAALAPYCGRAHVVGVTGAPGAGKSTLIGALIGELVRRGRDVAVLAVDPSSPHSGGALLGDRVRMSAAVEEARVFIRSLSARGELGGVTRTTDRILDVLDAAGFDTVIVETVGAGQSEIDIARIADTCVVVCPPGLGDDLQAIKAGILEIADILCLSKADQPGAERSARALDGLVGRAREGGWRVPLVRTAAPDGGGVAELADTIDAHAAVAGAGRRLARRAAVAAHDTPSSGVLGPDVAAVGASPSSAPSHGVAAAAATGRGTRTGDTSPAAGNGTPNPASDDALFARIRAWQAAGKGVALATVVRTWGSSPRPEGSHLAVEEGGEFIGSVSGGCIEGAVIGEARDAIADGRPRLLEFGVSDERAWEVGLACGGRVQVYVERIG
jgi:LAO/AO transport system ATPase